jgi:hypothetical protein
MSVRCREASQAEAVTNVREEVKLGQPVNGPPGRKQRQAVLDIH